MLGNILKTIMLCLFFIELAILDNHDVQQNIKHQLLTILQTGPLWPGTNFTIPSVLKDQYHELLSQHLTSVPISSSTLQGGTVSALLLSVGQGNSSHIKFTIKPTPVNPKHTILAELKIYVPILQFHRDINMIRVYQVVHNQPLNQPDVHRLLAIYYPSTQTHITGQWVTFNVLTAVNEWLSDVHPNLGFLIPELEYNDNAGELFRPLLILKFGSQYQGYHREATFEIQGWQNESSVIFDEAIKYDRCVREPWNLNFTDWGLLAPEKLDMGLCRGSCNITGLQSFKHVKYTALLSLMESIIPGLKKPCCVPFDYEPAPILYREENGNFVIRVLTGLMVKSCTCK